MTRCNRSPRRSSRRTNSAGRADRSGSRGRGALPRTLQSTRADAHTQRSPGRAAADRLPRVAAPDLAVAGRAALGRRHRTPAGDFGATFRAAPAATSGPPRSASSSGTRGRRRRIRRSPPSGRRRCPWPAHQSDRLPRPARSRSPRRDRDEADAVEPGSVGGPRNRRRDRGRTRRRRMCRRRPRRGFPHPAGPRSHLPRPDRQQGTLASAAEADPRRPHQQHRHPYVAHRGNAVFAPPGDSSSTRRDQSR